MTEFLLFRVYGPLVSWGDIAVGERRSTSDRPSRSGVIGLVAGALGIERSDEEQQTALQESLAMASRVDVPGRLMHDYHTAQAPSASWADKQEKRWKDKPQPRGPLWTRAEELAQPREELSTILSERAYLADTLAVVAIWNRQPNARFQLANIQKALLRPVFVPYLGRKSCPPALPFAPRLANAEHPVKALQQADFTSQEEGVLGGQLRHQSWPSQVLRTRYEQGQRLVRQFAWEGDWPALDNIAETVRIERRDQPGRRRAWQFHTRVEHRGSELSPQEVSHG